MLIIKRATQFPAAIDMTINYTHCCIDSIQLAKTRAETGPDARPSDPRTTSSSS